MVRDFTEETKERLLKQIDSINKNNWCWFSDALGDALLHVGKLSGILHLDDDMSHVESYHRRVLDMNNTTKDELNKIFEKVDDIDIDYSGTFSRLAERQTTYNERLSLLSGMIKFSFSLPTASSIRTQLKDVNNKLVAIDGKVNKEYIEKMDYLAKEALKDAGKRIIKGGIGIVIDIFTLKSPLDVYDILDDFFTLGCGLESSLNLIVYHFSKDDHYFFEGQKYYEVEGITEMLEANDCDGLAKITSGFEAIKGTHDICKGVKGFIKDPSSLIDKNFGIKDIKTFDHKGGYLTYKGKREAIGNALNVGYDFIEYLLEIPNGEDAVNESFLENALKRYFKPYETFTDIIDIWDNYKDTMPVVS